MSMITSEGMFTLQPEEEKKNKTMLDLVCVEAVHCKRTFYYRCIIFRHVECDIFICLIKVSSFPSALRRFVNARKCKGKCMRKYVILLSIYMQLGLIPAWDSE